MAILIVVMVAAARFHRTSSITASSRLMNSSIGTLGTMLLSTSLLTHTAVLGSKLNKPPPFLPGVPPNASLANCYCFNEAENKGHQGGTHNKDLSLVRREDFGSEEEFIVTNIMKNYNKQAVPLKEGVTVDVEILINDVTTLSEVDSEFELDIFFSEIWQDPAMNYSHLPGISLTNFTIGLEYLEKIWQPNICIVNSKSAVIHNSPSENVFLIIYDDGRVWRNCRMKVKAPCEIDLKTFPFDYQPCSLIFESYSYNSRNVRLKWLDNDPISYVKKIELPDFILIKHVMEQNRILYPNGFWDQLKVTFHFERRYGFFILQAYAPTYMVIFVAWINFWMDPLELGTRGTLSISAFLAMTFQFGTVVQNMPRVSYIKAIDIWMLGGIGFLFVALAELAVISYMTRTDRPDKIREKEAKEAEARRAEAIQDNINTKNADFRNNNNEYSTRHRKSDMEDLIHDNTQYDDSGQDANSLGSFSQNSPPAQQPLQPDDG